MRTLIATAAVLAALLAMPASAAQVIEEIVVTAQKRAESVNDVPVSISAVDEGLLNDAGLSDVTNLIPYVPGLNGQSAGMATNAWNVRGIGTNDWSSGSEPAVAVFMDDAYVGRNVVATTAFFDAERVEVVKGPQGTLFGRNASAGAINIITNKPSDANSLRVAYGRGTEDTQRIELVGNLAVSDALAFRLAVLDKQLEGISRNVVDGDEQYQDERALRLTARWDASERLTLLLSGHYNDADGSRVRPHNPGLAALFGLPGGGDPFAGRTSSDVSNREIVEVIGTNLRLDWDVSDTMAFTSISDWRKSRYDYSQDVDGIGAPLTVDLGDLFLGFPGVLVADGPTRFFQPEIDADTFSQEFRLTGTSGSVDWFLGASYFTEDVSEDANFSWPVTMDLDALLGGGGSIVVQTEADPARYVLDGDVESFGLYGDAEWHVTPRLSLTAGLRWSRDEKDYCSTNVDPTFGFLLLLGPDTGGQPICDSESWSEVTPRAVVSFQPTDATLLYASYARGYKGGGYNSAVAGSGPFGIDPPFRMIGFDPETSDAYEAGIKATMLGGAMQLNVAGFYTDYQDLQLLDTDLSLSITNIGDVESQGVEAELTWLPPLAGMTLGLSVAVLDSEIDAPGFTIDGSDLPQAPETTFGLTMRYEHALGQAGRLIWFAGYNWQDDQLFDVNGARVQQDDYGLLDASLSYLSPDERWELTLSGQNLTDEDYLIAASDPLGLGTPGTLLSIPRVVMLRLGVQLGEL